MNAAATTGNGVLSPNDAVQVLEELLPAQNQSYELGLKLKLPPHEVESIDSTYSKPRQRLLRIIMLFLNQVDPKPTWRVIVDALKSPLVNLHQLARAVEIAHFPDTTLTLVSETTGKIITSSLSSVFIHVSLFSVFLSESSPHLHLSTISPASSFLW